MVALDRRGTETRKKRLAKIVKAAAVLELMAWKLSCMKSGSGIQGPEDLFSVLLRSTLKTVNSFVTEGSKVQSTARLKNKEPGGPKKQLLSGFFALVVLLLAGEACARPLSRSR